MVQRPGVVYWITGLSGSGKSTLGRKLTEFLRTRGRSVVRLDGDELRATMGAGDAHNPEQRRELAMRYARLCKLLSSQGLDVVISTISLFHEIHRWNRENQAVYREIWLDVPIEELRRRDTKGLYAASERGELEHVAGLDLEVEFPERPDLTLTFDPSCDADATFRELVTCLELSGLGS